ncbi:hypothetical protein TPHA_0C01350 [Tetrapisispora phaffii CBS 4417]|uniref:cAMP-dependent protein kinase regulatory subunit n=1 Tax=Tetrapisispora phaffii (strain ATCC 24235 / CBS 4417 / NBRC 1672 / NRRL Y-8282 / UCD 70-5) TaxID=1071381 RepID=G8BRB5_TETPH|nr:hypothetical protein TPHA_0C01350 [Tetrapisispora phaffii CBS 4417]CCE62291.1 hypothetical protein TPHA_0C01350 [Tetrapisispora phaffii CBS 4417]
MPFSKEQEHFLNEFKEFILSNNPKGDLLQFGFNYFNEKLANERKLFLRNTYDEEHDETRNSIFKSPFAASQSRSTSVISNQRNSIVNRSTVVGTASTKGQRQGGDADSESDNPFKSDFSVCQSNDIKKSDSPLDPSTKRNSIQQPHPSSIQQPHHSNNNQQDINNSIHISSEIPRNFNALRRTSVSAESFEPRSFEQDWKPEHYSEKSPEQMRRLENSIGKNFLFNSLDFDSKKLVINSLEEKKVPNGSEIIKQGDDGDYFYVVEEGNVDFFVNDEKVGSSSVGSNFGELALMYNSPRAATVIATSDCILWALDRLTFRKILLGHSFKKRIMYEDFLKSVPILSSLTDYNRAKIADALEIETYSNGQVIIREGDTGENFYFIENGTASVTKEKEGVVAQLKSHDYFGEVALINDLPRQATVTATSDLKLATLSKSAFQRLLGPVVDVLKLNDPTRTHQH